jgi:hypothetical protein
VETVGSQLQAFHRSHERFEIATAAISTFPPPRLRLRLAVNNRIMSKAYMGKVEKWKSKNRISHFPTVPICLRRKEENLSTTPST